MTNDDGVQAPGILALRQAVDHLGEVFVIAPDANRSAIARGITIHDPLVVDDVEMADGHPAFAVSGTPRKGAPKKIAKIVTISGMSRKTST